MVLQGGQAGGKIHLCAPSNGAVDEILLRIIQKGLKGNQRPIQDFILRVGASSYESPEHIKVLELRHKVQKLADKERIEEIDYEINLYPKDLNERVAKQTELVHYYRIEFLDEILGYDTWEGRSPDQV